MNHKTHNTTTPKRQPRGGHAQVHSIADIEAGRKTGSVKTLKKLADALKITIDDLV